MDKIDQQIASLREGNTLTENEVKALCDKVTFRKCSVEGYDHSLIRLSVDAMSTVYLAVCVVVCICDQFLCLSCIISYDSF